MVALIAFLTVLISFNCLGSIEVRPMDQLLRNLAAKHTFCSAAMGEDQVNAFESCYEANSAENKLRLKCERLILPEGLERREFYCLRGFIGRNQSEKAVECLNSEREAANCTGMCSEESPLSPKTLEMVKCQESLLESVSAFDTNSSELFLFELNTSYMKASFVDLRFCNESTLWPEDTLQKASLCHGYSRLVDESTSNKCSKEIWTAILNMIREREGPVDKRRELFCTASVRRIVDSHVLMCVLESSKGKLPEGLSMSLSRPLWRTAHGARVHPFDSQGHTAKGILRRANCLEEAMKPSAVIRITD